MTDASAGASQQQPVAADSPRLRALLPPGPERTAAETVQELGLWERPAAAAPGRPRTLLNVVSSADGRATLQGRSAPLSSAADRELFHALRAACDGVLVGAGTLRAERYGPLVRDPQVRALRRRRGLAEEPLACVVSGGLRLDPAIPLLAEASTRLVVMTPSPEEIAPAACSVSYIRTVRNGRLDLTAALGELAGSCDVELLLCEGGPHLAGELVAAGLLDELFLSLAPTLAGGDEPGAAALRILAGAELDPATELRLLGALESESHLFLRYGVVAPERVSRETTSSSSEAS